MRLKINSKHLKIEASLTTGKEKMNQMVKDRLKTQCQLRITSSRRLNLYEIKTQQSQC